jgi:hypothetical protein
MLVVNKRNHPNPFFILVNYPFGSIAIFGSVGIRWAGSLFVRRSE